MNLRLRYLPMRRWRSLLGLPGAIGMAGLVLCLGLYFSVVQPAQQRLDTARYNASSMQERIARAGEVLKDKAHPLDEQLATFYSIFPSEHGVTDWIGKIAEIAQRDGLNLLRGRIQGGPRQDRQTDSNPDAPAAQGRVSKNPQVSFRRA